MIIEYHRPHTIEEALALLQRDQKTFPLGGGSWLNTPDAPDGEVVDLQDLGLEPIKVDGTDLLIGATATLDQLLNYPETPTALKEVIKAETNYNFRQVATTAGALVSADGRSPFALAMLTLDAVLTLLPGDEQIRLGDLLPLRSSKLAGKLITEIKIGLRWKLAYRSVARTPADLPIVVATVAKLPSGRTRVALGGYGSAPIIAMDGTEADGAAEAVENAYFNASDQWASADYRKETAVVLTKRCLSELDGLEVKVRP